MATAAEVAARILATDEGLTSCSDATSSATCALADACYWCDTTGFATSDTTPTGLCLAEGTPGNCIAPDTTSLFDNPTSSTEPEGCTPTRRRRRAADAAAVAVAAAAQRRRLTRTSRCSTLPECTTFAPCDSSDPCCRRNSLNQYYCQDVCAEAGSTYCPAMYCKCAPDGGDDRSRSKASPSPTSWQVDRDRHARGGRGAQDPGARRDSPVDAADVGRPGDPPVNITTTNMLLPAVQLVNYGLVAEYIEVTEGTCAEAGYEVIDTQDECNTAAAMLGLSDVRSSAVAYAGAAATSPAGCYLAQPHSQCEAGITTAWTAALPGLSLAVHRAVLGRQDLLVPPPGTGVRPERDDPSSGDLARRRRRLATPAFIAATLRRTRYVKVPSGRAPKGTS